MRAGVVAGLVTSGVAWGMPGRGWGGTGRRTTDPNTGLIRYNRVFPP